MVRVLALLLVALSLPGESYAQIPLPTDPAPPFQCSGQSGGACLYAERISDRAEPGRARYRIQAVEACPNYCVQTFWVTNATTGNTVLRVEGRGASLWERASAGDPPRLRTLIPGPGPTCCPPHFVDTIYVWDAERGGLLQQREVLVPLADLDTVRNAITSDGYRDPLR